MYNRITTFCNESMAQFRSTEHVFMVIIAVIIGLLGGFGAVGIQFTIKFFSKLFWGTGELHLDYLAQVPIWMKIGIPTGGALLVGAIVYFFAPEAKGHGVPEVMEAMACGTAASDRGWHWPSCWPHRSVSPPGARSAARGR